MSRLPSSDQHSKQKQPPTPQLLHAAANLLFTGNPTKLRLATKLINAWKQGGTGSSIDAVQLPLPPGAGSTKELLATLRADPCFRVVQGPAGGGYYMSLDSATLIKKAKAATKTGFLTEELPPPTGYVAGKHPIRPGQPNCKQFVEFGECVFNQRCVWNHPGKPSGDQHKPKQPTSSRTPAAPLVPAPPPSKPAWGGAGVAAAAARPAQQQQPSAQGATSSSNGNSAGAGPSAAPAAPSTSSNGINQTTSDSSSQVAAVPAPGAAQELWNSGCHLGACKHPEIANAPSSSSSSSSAAAAAGRAPPAQPPKPAAPSSTSASAGRGGPKAAPAALPQPANVTLLSQSAAASLRESRGHQLISQLLAVELDGVVQQLLEDQDKLSELLRVPDEVMEVWLAQNTAGSYVQGMLDHFACTRVGQKKGNIIGAGRTLQQQQPSAQGATSSSNGTSAGAGPSAPAAPSTSSNGINQTTSDSSSQVAAVPVQSAAYDQSAQQQPQQQQQQAAATPKLPPGFAAVHYQGRPCQLMMLRGFCPMGDKCPYDHPPRAGAGSQAGSTPAAATQQVATPSISTADHAATQGESPLSADAHPVTPEAGYKPAAQHAAAAHPAAPAAAGTGVFHSWTGVLAAQQQQARAAAAGTSAAAAAAAAAGTSAGTSAGSRDDAAAAAPSASSVSPGVSDKKLMGWTEGNLPQRRGEPNCPYYMGTGSCKFKGACVFHHPPAAEHPECILRGELPRKYDTNKQPPYGRLVQHLYRLYDYDSCVEAQLKIWLAKHVLSRNNPGSDMFSSSAKRPAYHSKGKGLYWQTLGPYTCSMGEAGQILHALWKAQPDEASSQPMPYTKQLRELLAGDPFWETLPDPKCASHFWVKLNVDKIKGLLNF